MWREHAFQLAVTFHGGMVGMAYEWGSPDHPHKKDNSGNWQVRDRVRERLGAIDAAPSWATGRYGARLCRHYARPVGKNSWYVFVLPSTKIAFSLQQRTQVVRYGVATDRCCGWLVHLRLRCELGSGQILMLMAMGPSSTFLLSPFDSMHGL